MSTDAITLVKSRCIGSVTAKSVLFVLADYADAEWSSFVGQKRLAAEAEVGERSVRRLLAELEGRGLIRRERRYREDGYRTSDRTVLVVDAIASLPATVAAKTLPATDDTLTGQGLAAQEPPVEPREPNGSRASKLTDEESTNRIGVWTALEDLFGTPAETDRKLRGKVLRSLLRADATHSEVHRRAKAWPKLFPEARLTPTALEKHWGQLGKLVADAPEWTPESCAHPAAADVEGDGSLWCPACERAVS